MKRLFGFWTLTSLIALNSSGCAHPAPVVHNSSMRWPDNQILRGANVSTSASKSDMYHFAAEWGGQVVRVLHLTPLSPVPPYAVNEDAVNDMLRTTQIALDDGLVVVFAPGVAMQDNDGFFSKPAYRAAFVNFWKRIAENFKNEKRTIAYDLMNEPHDKLARTEWSGFARELTTAIRQIDPSHTLIVEPPEWAWPAGFQYLTPTGDTNTIYSFHFYGPNEFTMTTIEQSEKHAYPGSVMEGELWNSQTMVKKLSPAFEFAQKNHVKVWCGEFGTARWSTGALNWLEDMIDILDAHHVGWAYYAYREWPVMNLEENPDFVKLIKESFSE